MTYEDIVVMVAFIIDDPKRTSHMLLCKDQETMMKWYKESQNSRHNGDCIKEPMTCAKCLFNDCERIAEIVIKYLGLKLEKENQDEPED